MIPLFIFFFVFFAVPDEGGLVTNPLHRRRLAFLCPETWVPIQIPGIKSWFLQLGKVVQSIHRCELPFPSSQIKSRVIRKTLLTFTCCTWMPKNQNTCCGTFDFLTNPKIALIYRFVVMYVKNVLLGTCRSAWRKKEKTFARAVFPVLRFWKPPSGRDVNRTWML